MAAVDAFRSRMEIISMFGYNLAQGVAAMCLASEKPRPEQMFPGWIKVREQTAEEMYQAMAAWCS